MTTRENEMSTIDYWNISAKVFDSFVQKIKLAHENAKSSNDSDFAEADLLLKFHQRIVSSANSMACLLSNNSSDCSWDMAVILRAVYEAVMQAYYIFNDKQYRADRVVAFNNFIAVEKANCVKRMHENRLAVARKLVNGEVCKKSKAEIFRESGCRESNYGVCHNRKGTWKFWHGDSVRELAKGIGWRDEYDLLCIYLAKTAHTTPLALHTKPVDIDMQMVIAVNLLMRFSGIAICYYCIAVNPSEQATLDNAKKSIFDKCPI